MQLYSMILDSKLYSSAQSMSRTKRSPRCSKRATTIPISCGRQWTQLSDPKKRLWPAFWIPSRRKMRIKGCFHLVTWKRRCIESKTTQISTDTMPRRSLPISLTSLKRQLIPKTMKKTSWSCLETISSSKMPNTGTLRYKGSLRLPTSTKKSIWIS